MVSEMHHGDTANRDKDCFRCKRTGDRLNFGLSNDNNENAFLGQVNLGAR